MTFPDFLSLTCVLSPGVLMATLAGLMWLGKVSVPTRWRLFQNGSMVALVLAGLSIATRTDHTNWAGIVNTTPLGSVLAMLVQLLGTVIGAFSARYLDGEANQQRYIASLAAVLASVHLMLLADHWLLLILAWTAVGIALEPLQCFYADRPFAILAAHKKRIADRVADLMLSGAASLAWWSVGSASLTTLWAHIAQHGMSWQLQTSAVLLVLAVTLRTALLPLHGWLIQVMEAPTPVSALLHAGVVNLGGFAMIRFAPMLEHANVARALLMALGLITSVLAGMVMLTRISIKVRLAWSTVAQMGFMLLECALGLYTLAALHLIGHSLYKTHTFLSASSVVHATRIQVLNASSVPSRASLVLAPLMAAFSVFLVQALANLEGWPWWWSLILGLAWAPLLWLPVTEMKTTAGAVQLMFGITRVLGLTVAALVGHMLPLGLEDAPISHLGMVALPVMAALYVFQALLQQQATLLSRWRRWSYAGFYLDEAYTRLALYLWPIRWTQATSIPADPTLNAAQLAKTTH